jgi:hypothetical protein
VDNGFHSLQMSKLWICHESWTKIHGKCNFSSCVC